MDPLVVMERQVVEMERKVRSLGRPLTHEERLHLTEEVGKIRAAVADEMAARMERPEVVSNGRPRSSMSAKRGLDEARHRLRARPQFQAACSDCPAAQTSAAGGEVVVRCGVEKTRLSSATSPQSLLTFCLGDYTACPSWRAERKRLALGQPELVGGT